MSRMLKLNGHFEISTYGTYRTLATTALVEPGMLYFEKFLFLVVFVPPRPPNNAELKSSDLPK